MEGAARARPLRVRGCRWFNPPLRPAPHTPQVKQALARAGIPSAFRAGKLLCAGAVVISRSADGDEGALEIEGPLSDDYYRM